MTDHTEFEKLNVKFEFIQDYKNTHDNLNLDYKADEFVNLPRYLATELEEKKIGKIQEKDMQIELKQAYVKEDISEFKLSKLDKNFYVQIKIFMSKVNKDLYKDMRSMLYNFVRKRHGKIIEIADSGKINGKIMSCLTNEEEKLYLDIYALSQQFTEDVIGKDLYLIAE